MILRSQPCHFSQPKAKIYIHIVLLTFADGKVLEASTASFVPIRPGRFTSGGSACGLSPPCPTPKHWCPLSDVDLEVEQIRSLQLAIDVFVHLAALQTQQEHLRATYPREFGSTGSSVGRRVASWSVSVKVTDLATCVSCTAQTYLAWRYRLSFKASPTCRNPLVSTLVATACLQLMSMYVNVSEDTEEIARWWRRRQPLSTRGRTRPQERRKTR